MRVAIFLGLFEIANAIYRISDTTIRLDREFITVLSLVFLLCLMQDIVSLFKKGAS